MRPSTDDKPYELLDRPRCRFAAFFAVVVACFVSALVFSTGCAHSKGGRSGEQAPKEQGGKPGAAGRPETVIVLKYENVSHRVAATITIVSVKESGCLRVDLVRRFDRREVSESRRRCLKKKQWRRLDRAVDAARVFALEGGYPCEPPEEGESKKRTKSGGASERSADGFSQSLSVRIGGRKKSIAPICAGPNATAPKALLDLVSLIKEVGLR